LKTYESFGDLKSAPKELQKYVMDMESHEPPHDGVLLMDYYGGNFHILEFASEIDLIETSKESEDGLRWLTLTETDDTFDICRWVMDEKYVEVVMMTTNAGGYTYFVPSAIAKDCPNLMRSIGLSSGI